MEEAQRAATDHRVLKVRALTAEILANEPMRSFTAPDSKAAHNIGYRSKTTRDEPPAWATAYHQNPTIVMKASRKKPTKMQLLERGLKTHFLLTTSDALEAEELEKQLHYATKELPWGARVNQKVGGVSSVKQAANSSKPGMTFQVYGSAFPQGLPDDMELVKLSRQSYLSCWCIV